MADIIEKSDEHGKIDLTHLIKAVIAAIQADPNNLLREGKGKIFAVTDLVIKQILNDKKLMKNLYQDGHLFSDTEYASIITTLSRSQIVREEQMKQVTLLEDIVFENLRKLNFLKKLGFSQQAASFFNAVNRLTNKKADTDTPQSSIFPDASLLKEYPGTKALLRIPHHTIQLNDNISDTLVKAVKNAVRIRLEGGLPEDEIEDIIDITDKNLSNRIGRLNDLLNILDQNIYGRIRRTYSCCVLRRMAEQELPANSPVIPYVRRVDEFNELVQGTLPESGLSPDDLKLEFPAPDGAGVIEIDLMNEFSRADAFDILPFWITFDEILSEITVSGKKSSEVSETSELFRESIITTMGQHFKMDGKVQNQGGASVFEFNLNKIESMAKSLKSHHGTESRESLIRILRTAVLYYVIFRDDSKQYRNALTNYKGLKAALRKWNADHVNTDEILMQIAARLKEKEILSKNRQIKKEFKALLTGRKPDNQPLTKQKLYLVINRDILGDQKNMEDAEPIKPPLSKDFTTGYLRFLKVTRHPESDYNALIKEEITLTEQIRYLILPDHKAESFERRMLRDKNCNITGVLFLPNDNDMLHISKAFDELTNLVISYNRDLLHGITDSSGKSDPYLAGIAQLIHILLVYCVLKAIARMTNSEEPDGNFIRHSLITDNCSLTMMILSLYAAESQGKLEEPPPPFTHDAHKAILHIIRQVMPVKSQGFKLKYPGEWKKLVQKSASTGKNSIPKDVSESYIKTELNNDYRFWNIVTGLLSGLDALWQLPEEPSIRKIALLTLTSRQCDRLNKRSQGDRDIMFGHIHRFEYETSEVSKTSEVSLHFYRHKPVQSFCDDMNTADRFKNPSILFHTVRKLYEKGFRDIMIITKVPFTRRIRMTSYEDSVYTNPVILQKINDEMPDLRVYPLFIQKSFGIRLFQGKTQYPIFLPHDPANDISVEVSDKSSLFRAASVVTYRIVEGGGPGEKIHSGITDYLFRCYPETMTIQSRAIAALTNPGKDQAALYEILRFIHANAYQKSVAPKGKSSPLEAKLDPFDTIIGEKSVGEQAEVLQFPKLPGSDSKYKFKINIIALLKHLENQSDLYRLRLKKDSG